MTDINKNAVRNNDDNEPVRLNKYLSDAGFCSRREADRLIEAGKVSVDGIIAVMGQKVTGGQSVTVEGRMIIPSDRLILLAFNKPAGIECTTVRENPDNIIDCIGYGERVFPVGRLDKPSTGLILLTNTGELVNSILKSVNMHEKEYVVTVDRAVSEAFVKQMSEGVFLKDVPVRSGTADIMTRKCRVWRSSHNEFHIILTQGINRQIRRMCKALGANVLTLHRVRIMNIELGDLPEGQYREVTEAETRELVSNLNI